MHKTALIDIKANNIHLYVGQKFDSSKFKLDKQGWTHEHCDDCFKRIEKNDFLFEKEGEVLFKNVVKIRQHITSDDHSISLL